MSSHLAPPALSRYLGAALLTLACSGCMRAAQTAATTVAASPVPGAKPAAGGKTSIKEFPHPLVNVHYHPRAGHQFTLDDARYALDQQCQDIELDLHLRGADVVCNHDSATPEAPRLVDVLDLIVAHKGPSPTVNGDGYQFTLVLEPKDDNPALLDAMVATLQRYAHYLSTAVGPKDGPRPITAVVTGGQLRALRARFADRLPLLNSLCLVEGHDYSDEIANLSPGGAPFQWASFRSPDQRSRVNAIHRGTDPRLRGRFNIRVWGEGEDLIGTYLSGVDSINTDHEQVAGFRAWLPRQPLLGTSPSLTVRGRHAAMAWKAVNGDLMLALGDAGDDGLTIRRQVDLSSFLEGSPTASAPAITILQDGRLFIACDGAGGQGLGYIAGRFTSPDRFLAFDGGWRAMASAGKVQHPAVATLSDGRIVLVYESPEATGLRYWTGRLDTAGALSGEEHVLALKHATAADSPAIAADGKGRLLILYRGTDDGRIWSLRASVDNRGTITGTETPAADGAAGVGASPVVAAGQDGSFYMGWSTGGSALAYRMGVIGDGGARTGTLLTAAGGDHDGAAPTAAAFGAGGRLLLVFAEPEGSFSIASGSPSPATPGSRRGLVAEPGLR